MTFTLIGMPGCGKSCMGRYISRKLRMKNIDSDKLIERKYKKRLHEIIEEVGIEEFKKIEEETLVSFDLDNIIFSTGGSAVYYPKAMEHLKSIGKVIYLYCSYEVIEKRLGDFSKRGVVLNPGQTLKDLYEERAPLYEKYADIIVELTGASIQESVQEVVRALKQ